MHRRPNLAKGQALEEKQRMEDRKGDRPKGHWHIFFVCVKRALLVT